MTLQEEQVNYSYIRSCINFINAINPLNWFIGLVGSVFANDPRDMRSIPGWVIPKTLKMVLDALLSNIRYVSRVKWKNPEKGVAPSPYTSV